MGENKINTSKFASFINNRKTISYATLVVILIINFLLLRVFYVSFFPDDFHFTKELSQEKRNLYKINPLSGFKIDSIQPELSIKNLKMIGSESIYGVTGKNQEERLQGMVLRVLRFQNISKVVEKYYDLPDNIILAMIMQETGGAEFLPNSSDDGGIGLCHMQGSTSREFNLATYKNCNKLVCYQHGKELRKLIADLNKDRKLLIYHDERFNPVINIDAVGRILAYHRDGAQTEDTPIATAICGYSGRKNFPKYYENVMYFLEYLNDKEFIESVKQKFNSLNKNLTIDDEKADFDKFILYNQSLNRNYGLDMLKEVY